MAQDRFKEGQRVFYTYTIGPTLISGVGTVIRNNEIVGTDRGYAIRRPDGEVITVRDRNVSL